MKVHHVHFTHECGVPKYTIVDGSLADCPSQWCQAEAFMQQFAAQDAKHPHNPNAHLGATEAG